MISSHLLVIFRLLVLTLPRPSLAIAMKVLFPFASVKFVAAKVVSAYSKALEVFSVTLVAMLVVVPATVNVPARVTVVSSFKLFTPKF